MNTNWFIKQRRFVLVCALCNLTNQDKSPFPRLPVAGWIIGLLEAYWCVWEGEDLNVFWLGMRKRRSKLFLHWEWRWGFIALKEWTPANRKQIEAELNDIFLFFSEERHLKLYLIICKLNSGLTNQPLLNQFMSERSYSWGSCLEIIHSKYSDFPLQNWQQQCWSSPVYLSNW